LSVSLTGKEILALWRQRIGHNHIPIFDAYFDSVPRHGMAACENPSLSLKLDPMREDFARADDEVLPGRQPGFHSLHYGREKLAKRGGY
jgi:hypothetical protein